ncbi:MAG: DUF4293 family protein [Bacteroidetes bacterium]|nr:MAG: DUF4293 family protein [Bacteroidota bacterium]MBL1143625.1 DUF4293 family protein [Bacteroidota bacterium]MCB0803657.1 DUF4293 domain-containing protein [Flavobacteriales bacterium]NOG56427.1 DUF4293 domain-containing protein [Bacteroidota bacterium]
MWQRIQTLFLAIAIAINLSLFFLNLGSTQVLEQTVYFTIYGFELPEALGSSHVILWLAFICTLSMTLSFVSILSFKKRQTQIKLVQFNLLLQLAFVVALFFAVEKFMGELSTLGEATPPEYDLGAYLTLIPLLFIFLALKNIKKDEALVRAADRIR